MEEIQEETAIKWAARSIAAYNVFNDGGELHFLTDAEEYRHEALEHAVFAADTSLLPDLEVEMETARAEALDSLEGEPEPENTNAEPE